MGKSLREDYSFIEQSQGNKEVIVRFFVIITNIVKLKSACG